MDVRLPRLGEGADSGSVASIFVKEGDHVKKDQSILELESEKAVASIPSPSSGTITKIHVKEGDEIKVGQLILSLSEDNGTTAQKVGKEKKIEETPRAQVEQREPEPVEQETAEPADEFGEGTSEAGKAGLPPPASPSIRRMARELGIDLRRVKGTDRGGRIVMADLRRYLARLQQLANAPKTAPQKPELPTRPSPEPIDFEQWGTVERKKMSKLRETISSRMSESWTTIPHVTQFDEADLSTILTLRKKYATAYENDGSKLTVTPFILKTLADLLKKHPKFNASLDEASGELVFKHYYHLGIAVDTEQGLIVPVIRDVDKKSLLELSSELNELAERTRQRKVSLDEMQGSTFTISNQGGIGGAHFTPIINKPDAAILGLGRAVMKPVVVNNKMVQRMMLPLGLSYDHRIADGADAARFITELVHGLQKFKEEDVKLVAGKRKKASGKTRRR